MTVSKSRDSAPCAAGRHLRSKVGDQNCSRISIEFQPILMHCWSPGQPKSIQNRSRDPAGAPQCTQEVPRDDLKRAQRAPEVDPPSKFKQFWAKLEQFRALDMRTNLGSGIWIEFRAILIKERSNCGSNSEQFGSKFESNFEQIRESKI